MSNRMNYQTYNGVEITIDDYGTFCAEVNGNFLSEPTLDRLKKRIEEERMADAKAIQLALPCYGLIKSEDGGDEYAAEYIVTQLTLTGINRNDSSLKYAGHKTNTVFVALPASAQNLELLTELARAQNVVNRVHKQIDGRDLRYPYRYGGRIQPSEYAGAIEKLRVRYAEYAKEPEQ